MLLSPLAFHEAAAWMQIIFFFGKKMYNFWIYKYDRKTMDMCNNTVSVYWLIA